jgi:hypothetical protein
VPQARVHAFWTLTLGLDVPANPSVEFAVSFHEAKACDKRKFWGICKAAPNSHSASYLPPVLYL